MYSYQRNVTSQQNIKHVRHSIDSFFSFPVTTAARASLPCGLAAQWVVDQLK